MAEVVTLAGLAAAGVLLALGLRVPDSLAVGIGFPLAVAIYVVAGFVLLVLRLPAHPAVLLGLVALAGGAAAASGSRGWGGVQRWELVAGAAALAGGAAAVIRLLRPLSFTADSFLYLGSAGVLAETGSAGGLSGPVLLARGFSVPRLHALGHVWGAQLVAGAGLALGLSAVALLVGVARRLWPSHSADRLAATALLAALLAAVCSANRVVFHAAYVHSHMLVAAMALVTCVMGWEIIGGRARGVAPALVAAAPLAVIALARPEGSLFAALLLAPIVAGTRTAVAQRATLLLVPGVAVLGWYGTVVAPAGWLDVPGEVPGQVALGVLLVVAGATARWWERWARQGAAALVVAHVVLWVALVPFAARDAGLLTSSLRATAENLLLAEGLWGRGWIPALVALVLAAWWGRGRGLSVAVFPVASFVPLALLSAGIRGVSYRVGPGDSLNRMWLHVVFVGAFIVLVAALPNPRPDRDPPST